MEKVDNLIPMAIFAQVVECLSFTDAAAALGISKSSVSRAISQLEETVGGRLLKRTTRRIEITELGIGYARYCASIVSELRASETFIKEYYQQPAGTLTLLAPVTYGTQHVVPALSQFLKNNIHARIDLDLSDKEIDIKESDYDLAIEVLQGTPAHEHAQFLCTIGWGLYATPDYLQRIGPINAPKDLPGRDYILFRGVARTVSLPFRREKQKFAINVESRFRSNNSIALITMALSGCGIAYLPTYAARASVGRGELVRILPGWTMDEYKIWLLAKEKNSVTSAIKRFCDELRQHVAAAEHQ
ncbi:LysR family transcriptional regulator [Pluralibacter gergoviae]|uniref:LysR family transcriptional regulator n=1 Tax=Pluralibacter gergoviae TaxID=61647 RepID=UPI000A387639|nr:LysR family transcriptional regulator [Pluralibacter gergoviae]EKT9642156.1 LysR family transcriptional regulator [Pluralibacter gergoviae]EKV3544211.1 LysR family transcriptional regulator [Pluralibacter gergoviae]EKV9899114.1 LysR family transcriptional regulator [Pluralibacter gergoviae]EKV9930356.1 LysR family transcriptional regulator [Pluralibacter gergoviae]EKW9977203.1 LysR family transcriptional regulator [Pluralibacter gergoviae]